MPKSQRPDGAVTGSTKRLVSRFYQMKTGHCLSGQYLHYLHWTKNQPTPQCWWCGYRIQTREHLFKERPEWKAQQKILWAEVRKEETGSGRVGGGSGTSWPMGGSVRLFFVCLIILACSLSRLWRRTFYPFFPSSVRAVAARCTLPFALRPCPSQEDVMRTKGITKEREAERA